MIITSYFEKILFFISFFPSQKRYSKWILYFEDPLPDQVPKTGFFSS